MQVAEAMVRQGLEQHMGVVARRMTGAESGVQGNIFGKAPGRWLHVRWQVGFSREVPLVREVTFFDSQAEYEAAQAAYEAGKNSQ